MIIDNNYDTNLNKRLPTYDILKCTTKTISF